MAVDHDASVAGVDGAIRALVRRAAAQGAVSVAVTTGRVEVRDAGSAAVAGFDGDLAGGLARRAGGEVHLFEGLAVLELPAAVTRGREVRRVTQAVSGLSLPVPRHPRACWWHVTGCQVPTVAGRARRNAS